ncbi:MAG: SusD/RagB family nutrient-binding outer membrane lipoprotein [Balneolaceae bacterium]
MKERITDRRFILLSLLLLMLGACTDHFDDLNTPPNQTTAENVDGSLLGQAFAYAQYWGHFGPASPTQTCSSHYGDIYAQYFTQTAENFDSDQFQSLGRRPNSCWNWFYGNTAPQLKFVEDLTAEEGMVVQNAVAKVWRVYVYHRITDFWGPIIYSQFGNGETSVMYDSQEDVYMDFFETLDEAIAVLEQNANASVFGIHDQVYEGNVGQWIKFANSIRLRLALRISYVEPALAQTEAEKAVNAGVIESVNDNATLLVTDNSANGYNVITNWGEFRMSAAMQSTLEGYDDPRLPEYFNEASTSGEFRGLRNGLPRTLKPGTLNSDYSDMDDKWLPANTPGPNRPLVRAAEVYFLRAEGALRNWDMGGTAEELYNEGIRASMLEYTAATTTEIDAYIQSMNTPTALNDPWSSPAHTDIPVRYDALGSFERQLEQIITQKWIALYPDSWEAWSERRRTGYPVGYAILSTLNPDLGLTDLFRRVGFTEVEYANNAAGVEQATGLLSGPDNNKTRLWWDVKPLSAYPTPVD